MEAKLTIWLLLTLGSYSSCQAALRRVPKVYNALITTDENLTSSRAYPVIQPTIHESGIAQYPFGPFSPIAFYSPPIVRFAQPIAPGLEPKEQLAYPLTQAQTQFAPQLIPKPLNTQPQPFRGYPLPATPSETPTLQNAIPQAPPTAPAEQPQPTAKPSSPPPTAANTIQPQKIDDEQLPISLNEYGLPPALIPYPQYPSHIRQSSLSAPPFVFQQYPPLYYNPLTGLGEQYLPPYEYLPTGAHFPLSNTIPSSGQTPSPSFASQPHSTPPSTSAGHAQLTTAQSPTAATESITEPSFESIKNGSKSKDSNVPDVPPPPIPSTIKSKQS